MKDIYAPDKELVAIKSDRGDKNFNAQDLRLYVINKLKLKRIQNAFLGKTSLNKTENDSKVILYVNRAYLFYRF